MTAKGVTALLVLLLGAGPLAAQQSEPEIIDRVAAVVGERMILLSEVDEEINRRRAQGLQVPEDTAAMQVLRRQVLGDLVDNEVVYQNARRDTTIQVTDAEVQQAVDEAYQQIRGRFRTEREMQAALAVSGFVSLEEWRRWFADDQRKDLYRQRYFAKLRQDGRLRGGSVPDSAIRRAYDETLAQQAERPRRPPTIAFRQIVLAPQPTDSARAVALVRAESVRVEIEAGRLDFATAARRFSDDPSGAQGGDLGWFRREAMVREFSETAFNLRPSVVSPVVRTAFGYHLIMVDRVQPAEVKARHILFAPAITETDVGRARAQADSLALMIRAGARIDSLARIYGDSTEPRVVGPVDRTQLDSTLAQVFTGAAVGDRVGPFVVTPDGNVRRLRVVVAEVTEVEEGREFTFDEVRERIRLQLQQQRAVSNLLESLRRRAYIDIRL